MAEAKGKVKNIAGRIREVVAPLIEAAGYVVWDVQYYKDVSEMTLEIVIDKDQADGISTDDCMAVTKIVDPILDDMDPIEESYSLVVSSAGSERELHEPFHYDYAKTRKCPVTVKTFAAIDGKKQFDGFLSDYSEDSITLQAADGPITFEKKQVGKITAFCEPPADSNEM